MLKDKITSVLATIVIAEAIFFSFLYVVIAFPGIMWKQYRYSIGDTVHNSFQQW